MIDAWVIPGLPIPPITFKPHPEALVEASADDRRAFRRLISEIEALVRLRQEVGLDATEVFVSRLGVAPCRWNDLSFMRIRSEPRARSYYFWVPQDASFVCLLYSCRSDALHELVGRMRAGRRLAELIRGAM